MSNAFALPKSLRSCPYCRCFGSSAHIARCGQQEVRCSLCDAVLQAAHLEAHTAFDCDRRERLLPCAGCGVALLPCDLLDHLRRECKGEVFRCTMCGEVIHSIVEYIQHAFKTPLGCQREAVNSSTKESDTVAVADVVEAPKSVEVETVRHVGAWISKPIRARSCQPYTRRHMSRILNATMSNNCRAESVGIQTSAGNRSRGRRGAFGNAVSNGGGELARNSFTSPCKFASVSHCGRRAHSEVPVPLSSTSPISMPKQKSHLKQNISQMMRYNCAQNTKTKPSTLCKKGQIHKLTMAFLKELQNKQEVVSLSSKQRNFHTMVASPPQFATEKLHQARLEKKLQLERENTKFHRWHSATPAPSQCEQAGFDAAPRSVSGFVLLGDRIHRAVVCGTSCPSLSISHSSESCAFVNGEVNDLTHTKREENMCGDSTLQQNRDGCVEFNTMQAIFKTNIEPETCPHACSKLHRKAGRTITATTSITTRKTSEMNNQTTALTSEDLPRGKGPPKMVKEDLLRRSSLHVKSTTCVNHSQYSNHSQENSSPGGLSLTVSPAPSKFSDVLRKLKEPTV